MKKRIIKFTLIFIISLLMTSSVLIGVKTLSLDTENKTLCEHKFTKSVILQKPTCEETGLKISECELCGEETQEILKSKGHTEEIIAGKEAGCEREGLTDGIKCNECGEIVKEQEIITAKGHNYKTETAIEVECMEDGKVNHICNNCGKIILETISAAGHQYESGVCVKCKEPITEVGLSLEEETLLNYDYARPTLTFQVQATLGLQKRLTSDEEIGGIIVALQDIESLENISSTTDWVEVLEEAGVPYTYKSVMLDGVKGTCSTDAILYEQMTQEYVVIPCIKTERKIEHLMSYRYAENFYDKYKEYSTSIAYLTGNHMNANALGEGHYTETQLINLNHYVDEIVDYIQGLPTPIYDGSFLNFGQDENNKIQASVEEQENGDVIVSWDLPWLFDTKVGIIADIEESERFYPIKSKVKNSGLMINFKAGEFTFRDGISLYLFGYRFSLGIDIEKQETKGAGTR